MILTQTTIAASGTSTPSVIKQVTVAADTTWSGTQSKVKWCKYSNEAIFSFSKMQCDLRLNVDCTEYELYYFPDGEDVRVYDSLHGSNDIESPSSLNKAKTAFCLYMDG